MTSALFHNILSDYHHSDVINSLLNAFRLKKTSAKSVSDSKLPLLYTYIIDVLWCQPIKLIQVVSTSEFHEY
jgi:hypothetical protein